jgi:hypothetical protein
MADSSPAPAAPAAPGTGAPLKKGALVRLNLQAYRGSVEAGASDPEPPTYVIEGPGEILAVKGAYAQLRWRRPVPDVWLRLDQLEAWSG